MQERSVSKEEFLDRAETLKERIATLGGADLSLIHI